MEKLATYIVREGPLAAHDAIGWVARLAATLEPIHGLGVSHGRVSTKALQIEDPACTTSGYLLDTADLTDDPAYYSMARTEGGPRSPQCDVWAVAVTLYQLLTGTLPFPGTTSRAVKRRLLGPPPAPLAVFDVGDDKLQRILDRLLERNPAERLTSIGELRKALEEIDPLVGTLPPLSYGKPGDSEEDDGWEDDDSEDDEQLTAVRELPMELLKAVGEIKRQEAAAKSPPDAPAPPAPPSAPSSPGEAVPQAPNREEPSEDIDVLHDVYDEETQLAEVIPPSLDDEPSVDEEIDVDEDAQRSEGLFGGAVVTAPADEPAPQPGAEAPQDRSKPQGSPPPRPPPPPVGRREAAAKPKPPPVEPPPPAMFPSSEPAPAEPEGAKAAAAEPKAAEPKRKPADARPPAPAVPTPADAKPRMPLPSSKAGALLVSTELPKPKRGRKVFVLVLLAAAAAAGALFVLRDPLGLGLHHKLRRLWSTVTGAPAPSASTSSPTPSPSVPPSPSAPSAPGSQVVPSAAPSASAASAVSSVDGAASSDPPAASASASASAAASSSSAPAAPAGDLRACVEPFFPEDTFVGRNPKFGSLCKLTNPLKGSIELRTQVVLCGGGMKGVTDGMHEWSTMGWYGMAAFVVIRSHCCEGAEPIKAPKTVAKCDIDKVLVKLGKTAHGSDDEAADQAVEDYTKAINCLARGGAARLFDQSGFPKGGELTTFNKVFDRARKQAKP